MIINFLKTHWADVFLGFILFLVSLLLLSIIAKIDTAKQIIETIFSVGFVTAVSAFAGVWGAQRIIEKNKRFESIVAEVRAVNHALILTKITLNEIYAFKEMILPILKGYKSSKKELEEDFKSKKQYTIKLDFMGLQKITIESSLLRQIVFERLDANKSMIFDASRVKFYEDFLNVLIDEYNSLINEVAEMDKDSEPQKIKAAVILFGIMHPSIKLSDTRISDRVDQILINCDNILYHVYSLGESLHMHGLSLKEYCRTDCKIVSFERDVLYRSDLMPSSKEFPDYEEAFWGDSHHSDRN